MATITELPVERRVPPSFERYWEEKKLLAGKLSPEIKALEGTGSLVDLTKAYFDVTGVSYKIAEADNTEAHLPGIDQPVEPGSIILDSGPCKVIIEELTKVCGFSIRVHCPRTSALQDFSPSLINLMDAVERRKVKMPLIDLDKPFAQVDLEHDELTPKIVELISGRKDGEGGMTSAQFLSHDWDKIGGLQISCKCNIQRPVSVLECTAIAKAV